MNATTESQAAERRNPTIDTLSPALIAAIRAIPPHDANTKITVKVDARRPASIFTDPARYDLEQKKLFKRVPVAVSLSAMLPEPGSVLAHDGYGIPILLTRDRQGQARAFLNVCRHKGAKLVENCEPHKLGRITCPYHAWTYANDGRLLAVPREEGFPSVKKADYGLVSLHCKEAGGLIWVILDRHADPDFSNITPGLAEDLDSLGIGTGYVYGRRSFKLAANWKLVFEPFLEGYHVVRLHSQTVGPFFKDVPVTTRRLGPHISQVSGRANFTPEMLDIPGENIHKTVTITFQILPNTVVITSPYYLSVMIIQPNAVNRSTVDYYMLTRGAPDNPKAEDLYAKSFDMIQKVFGTEDFRAAEISQAGLESGAIDELVYGDLEKAIPEFYESVEGYL
jgi:phenylpropionate dioxygenase-like ring-hydroxylating dioxygenase large terminal subunit